MSDRRPPGNSFSRWRKYRKIRRESKHLIKEAARILRKHRYRLKDAVAEDIDKSILALREAVASKRFSQIREKLEKLDVLVDRHLAFGRKSAFREYSESIGVAVLVALLLRAFVVEAFKIPSGSMIPTLEVGDHLFVNKFIYGFRIPFTNFKFWEIRKPKRGEVIVFVYPGAVCKVDTDCNNYPKETCEDNRCVGENKDFIKRIVAVEGDVISFSDDKILINRKPVKRRRMPGPCSYLDTETGRDWEERRDCVAYEEEQDDTKYMVIQDKNGYTAFDRTPRKVPEGHVFVMGDNRDNSHDSRFWGTVPHDYIKGRAIFIWWSYSSQDGVRWSRFFQGVHSPPVEAPRLKNE